MPDHKGGGVMLAEIREQPQALARLLEREGARLWALAKRWRQGKPRFIFLAARGTSDHAALYGKYVLETLTGIPVGFVAPSVTTVYEAQVDYRDGLVIGVSQSGEAADVAAVLASATAGGADTLAITNVPGSPLTELAGETLLLHAGPERAVAATKTYTGTLAALLLLAAAIADDRALREALQTLPALLADTLKSEAAVREQLTGLCAMEECVTLGRGYNLATAYELALKLRETAAVRAQPYASPDFVHGPIAGVPAGYPVIAFANEGPALPSVEAVLEQARERGACVAVVGNARGAAAAGEVFITAEALNGVGELLTPFPCAVISQVMAHEWALRRGHDPDKPPGLHKVTVTY